MDRDTATSRTSVHPGFVYALGAAIAVVLAFEVFESTGFPAFDSFSAIFVSLMLEGIPFLLLGSLVASAVGELLPQSFFQRRLAGLGAMGIPVTAVSGFAFPVCECAIVPTIRRLREKGFGLPYAMTMLVAVPLINPVVIASTVAAFSNRPFFVLARFVGGFIVALIVGALFWRREGRVERHGTKTRSVVPDLVTSLRTKVSPGQKAAHILEHTIIEFVEILAYFAAGSALSAAVQAFVPATFLVRVGANPVVAIYGMIALAFFLSVCSEADAFIGKAFVPIAGEAAVLAFLIFGPMLDLKNTLLLRRVISSREISILAAALIIVVPLLAVVYGQFLT